MILDQDWRFAYLNEAAASFLQTKPSKVLGKVIWDAFPHLKDSRFYEGFTRAAGKNIFARVEEYYEPRNRWYECRCHPTEGGLTVFINDATSHKKIEEVMLESRQVLEMAITGSNAGIWRADLDPQRPGYVPDYLYLSPHLKALVGFENDELPNSRRAWYDRIVPEDLPRIQEATEAHFQGRTEKYQVDFRIRHKDGSLRWLSSQGRLFHDEFNRPIRWAGIDMDITESKLAAETLREQEEQLREALEAGRVFTFEWNPATDVVLRSANCTPILGWTGDTTHDTGQSFFKRIHPEDREGFISLVSALSPDHPVYETTYRYMRADNGREVVLEESGCAVFDESEKMVCLRGLTRDVTARKLAEEALRRLNEQLEQRVEERTCEIQKANEALRQASAYNRSLIEASLDPLVTIGPDGRITDVNRATEEVTGRSRTELIGTDFSNYFTEPEKANEGYRTVFRKGSVHDYPLEIRHASGRITPVLYNATVYRDEAGEVIGVFAAARDVTELRRASAYNRSLIEASLDPLVTIGPDGRITDVNRATEEVTGRSRTELIGTDFSNYFTEPEKANEGYRTVFRKGSVHDYPLEIRHASGRITPVLYNATVYRDEAGEVIGVFAAARDMTALRRAEHVRARLAAIVESSEDAIIGKNLDGIITSWNRGAQALYGYAAEEIIGKSITLLELKDNPGEIERILDRVRRGEAIEHCETVRVTKGGRPISVSLTVSPIRDAAGQVTGISTIARDITRRTRAEEAVKAERQRLFDVLETLPVYVILLTPDHHVPFANKFFRERFGESGGKRCFEYLFQFTEPCENCDTYTVLKTHAPHHWEWTGPDGRIYDIHDFPFTDSDGSTLIMEMGIDITEQRRAEEELKRHGDHLEELVAARAADLKAANERLQLQTEELTAANGELCKREQELERAKEHWERTFHSVPDLIAIMDGKHRVVQANQAMADRLGVTPEECIGLPCYQAVHGLDAPPAFCPHARTLEDGKEYEVEVHEDRLHGDFLVNTTPLHDEKGRMIGSIHVARDITERKKAEESLTEAHRRTQGIIDNTASVVYVFDLEARFILANAAVAKVLNTTAEQLLGKRRHEFMPKEDADWHEANDRRVIEAGHAMEFEEHSELPGRSITWLTTKFPLRDAQGRIYAVAGISADISERKRTEEELHKHMEELQIANEELTRFNRAMVNREVRMVELKREINELCLRNGQTARYNTDPEQKEKP